MASDTDLLRDDIAHIRKLLVANEEGGDRRVAFLIALVTAVAAGLVALQAVHIEDAAWVGRVTDWTLASLLVVGVMVFLRVKHRNRMSTHYQSMIDQAWALAVADSERLKDAAYNKSWSPPARNVFHYIRGGHAVTVGAVVAILIAVICRVSLAVNLYASVMIGVGAFVVLLLISLDRK